MIVTPVQLTIVEVLRGSLRLMGRDISDVLESYESDDLLISPIGNDMILSCRDFKVVAKCTNYSQDVKVA